MKLALIQMSNLGSIEANLNKSLQAIEKAASQGAELVLFPEVQLTEFFPQYRNQEARKIREQRPYTKLRQPKFYL